MHKTPNLGSFQIRNTKSYVNCRIFHEGILFFVIDKGNSSIPLFKTHKSMDKKRNRGNKLKLRETH